ncbi:hypothetical protein LOC67_05525 [Stieleria sp. JC731]|nr:hypothetical protein [Stieleria sp. JC731]MCC9600014.1 hypothetical protein [Stieleria sp. JC731]
MRLNVQVSGLVKTTCPTCQKSFQINVPASAPDAAPVAPPANVFDSLPPAMPGNSTSGQGGFPADPFGSSTPNAAPVFNPSASTPAYLQAAKQKKSKFRNPAGKLPIKPIAIGGGVLSLVILVGVVVSFVDLKNFSPSGIVSDLQAAIDSPKSILSDMESTADRAKAVAKQIPAGDQSEESAKKLLKFTKDFEGLLLRACRLSPQSEDLTIESIKLHDENQLNVSPVETLKAPDPSEPFWSPNIRSTPDKHVTRAVTMLTLVQLSIRGIVENCAIQLPDPRSYQNEQLDWEDHDRRLLAIIQTRAELKRDATRIIASLDRDNVSDATLGKLHDLIDRYAERSRALIDPNGEKRILVPVPRGTIYNRQDNASKMAWTTIGAWLKEGEALENIELKFLIHSTRSLDDDIDDLMYDPRGTGIVVDEMDSYARFEHGKAEAAKAAAQRVAALEALQRNREAAEKKRLAEVERKRAEAERRAIAAAEKKKQAEEERRRLEAERKVKQAEEKTDSVASNDVDTMGTTPGFGGMRGRIGGPPSFGPRPSGRRGSMGPAPGFAEQPGSGETSDGGRRGSSQRQTGFPEPGPNDVVITVEDASGIHLPTMNRSLPDWVRKYAISMSQSNNQMTIRVSNFDQPLIELESGFSNLTFIEIDDSKRTIKAKPR